MDQKAGGRLIYKVGPEGWRQAHLQGEVIKYRKDQKAGGRLIYKMR
jgi:hypothetical protein